MTSYLATIRIEAFGLAEAKRIAEFIAGTSNALGSPEVVSVVQEPLPLLCSDEGGPVEWVIGGHEEHPLPSEPPRYVSEAIEAAKAELRAEMRDLFATHLAGHP